MIEKNEFGMLLEEKIQVKASDGNLLDKSYGTAYLKKDVDEDNSFVYYSPIFINRAGLEKQILTYEKNGERNVSSDLLVPNAGKKVILGDRIDIEPNETKNEIKTPQHYENSSYSLSPFCHFLPQRKRFQQQCFVSSQHCSQRQPPHALRQQ